MDAFESRLTLEFTGYWLSGTGAARGRDVDAITHRDRDGLPAMPMTQIKGQLRETARRLAGAAIAPWGWTDPAKGADLVTVLFGPTPETAPDDSTGGVLAFRGEARMAVSPEVRLWLAHEDQASWRSRLFARLPATSIGPLGAAEDHTLRAVEAAVPLTLEGRIERVGEIPPGVNWIEALDLACAATLAFGKLKTDGCGRVIARMG